MIREISDLVEMVFAQDETAKAYCRKIYRFFVSPKISTEIETDIIQPLAMTMMDNNYELIPVLTQLLNSKHFYDLDDTDSNDEIIGALIKSPLELYTHITSFFDVSIPDPLVDPETHYNGWYKKVVLPIMFEFAGMTIFQPESVAGYPAYYQAPGYSKNWFSGSSIIARYKTPEIFLTGERILLNGSTGGVALDIVEFVKKANNFSDPSNSELFVTEITDYLLPEMPTTERFNYFLNEVFLDNLSPLDWKYSWENYLISNDPTAVQIPLENLVKTLLSSQEFQCM